MNQKPQETPPWLAVPQLLAVAGQLGAHITLSVSVAELRSGEALVFGSVVLDGHLHVGGLASSIGGGSISRRHIGKER